MNATLNIKKSQLILAFFMLYAFASIAQSSKDSVLLDQSLKALYTKQGVGETPKDGQKVRIMYKGRLADGTIFDDGGGVFFSFKLGDPNIIPGMQIAVKSLQKGGKGIFKIPSEMGYGTKGVKDDETGKWLVPPKATLWFEIELLGFK